MKWKLKILLKSKQRAFIKEEDHVNNFACLNTRDIQKKGENGHNFSPFTDFHSVNGEGSFDTVLFHCKIRRT